MTQQAPLLERMDKAIAFLKLLQDDMDKALAELTITKGEKNEMGAMLVQVESKVDEILGSTELPPEAPKEGLQQELEECRKTLQETKAELEHTKEELQRAEFRVRNQASKMRQQAPQMARADWENVAKTARRDPDAFMREIGERGLLPRE
ncbi:MAG: hypothetical protein A2Y72_01405 [Chloroflexi bacterium RBG_13_53_26]|jgi:chromosome segregation ATPase|nr:MAG: hypothetical protein A2Y72_01405 [Chloroflexi bacterium RBG_13_53_26]